LAKLRRRDSFGAHGDAGDLRRDAQALDVQANQFAQVLGRKTWPQHADRECHRLVPRDIERATQPLHAEPARAQALEEVFE